MVAKTFAQTTQAPAEAWYKRPDALSQLRSAFPEGASVTARDMTIRKVFKLAMISQLKELTLEKAPPTLAGAQALCVAAYDVAEDLDAVLGRATPPANEMPITAPERAAIVADMKGAVIDAVMPRAHRGRPVPPVVDSSDEAALDAAIAALPAEMPIEPPRDVPWNHDDAKIAVITTRIDKVAAELGHDPDDLIGAAFSVFGVEKWRELKCTGKQFVDEIDAIAERWAQKRTAAVETAPIVPTPVIEQRPAAVIQIEGSRGALITQFQAAIERTKMTSDLIRTVRDEVMVKGVDYGPAFGDGKKDTLLKPGAEKLCRVFRLRDQFIPLATTVVQWSPALFYFHYECRLYEIETDLCTATGIGSCNSMEFKYGFRWVSESDVPARLDKSLLDTRNGAVSEFEFAIKKAETTGKYGKPAEYWQRFAEAIENGTARSFSKVTSGGKSMTAWEIGSTQYAIPNTGIFDQVNTMDKMAQKRALIAATLIGTGASALFTQDVEDMPSFGYIDAEIVA